MNNYIINQYNVNDFFLDNCDFSRLDKYIVRRNKGIIYEFLNPDISK